MPTGVLHIGFPKTGSSSIQHFLLANRDALFRTQRIQFLDLGHVLGDVALLKAGTPDAAARLRMAIRPEARRIVMSSEKLAHADAAEVENIRRVMSSRFDATRIVVYLRRQDEAFVSSYATKLMAGETRRFSKLPFMFRIDYREKLLLWENAFGIEALAVRRVGAADYFAGGHLLADFAKSAGLDDHALARPPSANVSPAAETLEFQRLLNVALGSHPERRLLLKRITQAGLPGTQLGVGRRQRLAMLQHFSAANQAIARHYFGLPRLFTHPLRDDASPEIVLKAADFLAFTARLLEAFGLPMPATSNALADDRAAAIGYCANLLIEHLPRMQR